VDHHDRPQGDRPFLHHHLGDHARDRGAFAEILRAQLATPNGTLVSFAQYNELFTMHGSVMIYLFAGPSPSAP